MHGFPLLEYDSIFYIYMIAFFNFCEIGFMINLQAPKTENAEAPPITMGTAKLHSTSLVGNLDIPSPPSYTFLV